MKFLFLVNMLMICCLLQSCQEDDLPENSETTRLLDQRVVRLLAPYLYLSIADRKL